MNKLLLIFVVCIMFMSCESEADRKIRLEKERQHKIELEAQKKKQAEELAIQKEKERIEREIQEEKERKEREIQEEKERKEKAIYDKYINNSLRTGATPYAKCFGRNRRCSSYGCSQITVRTPYNSDVIVTIKKNKRVYRHAYIKANDSYTFELVNGTYQTFFYYGKGWNPNKKMNSSTCKKLKGGFVDNVHFGKDYPQHLSNNILTYELILQQNGNFSTKLSSAAEAL